jgi:hypothetical protein
MCVISTIAIQVTREHLKSYKGISRFNATNTRRCYPSSSRTSSSPPRMILLLPFSACFLRVLRALLMVRRSACQLALESWTPHGRETRECEIWPATVRDLSSPSPLDVSTVLELKCAERLCQRTPPKFLNSASSGRTVCLLVNFQKPKVEWKRIVLGFTDPA